MFRHVLCPVDFSPCSQRAVEAAARIAKTSDASITALHVRPPRIMTVGEFVQVADPRLLGEAERAEFDRSLEQFMEPAAKEGLRLKRVVTEGDASAAILGQARALGADLIVMGRHSRSAMDRWLLGSVAERVLEGARVPVMTVAADARLPEQSFRSILCAESLGRPSRAFEFARSLATAGEPLVVLHAVETLPPGWDPGRPPLELGPQLLAAAVARAHEGIGETLGDCVEVLVEPGPADETIVRCARERKVDLVVVGVHDRNPIELLFLGSTARRVVRRADCPVLSVRGELLRSLIRTDTHEVLAHARGPNVTP